MVHKLVVWYTYNMETKHSLIAEQTKQQKTPFDRMKCIGNIARTAVQNVSNLFESDLPLDDPAQGAANVIIFDGDDVNEQSIPRELVITTRNAQRASFEEFHALFGPLTSDPTQRRALVESFTEGWDPDYWQRH